MFIFSQKTCSIFEAVWFHFVLEFTSVLFALQIHLLKLRSDTKLPILFVFSFHEELRELSGSSKNS